MTQKVFHLELKECGRVVVLEEKLVEEIDSKVQALNAQGWEVLNIFPLCAKKGLLCHDKELVVSHVGLLCTQKDKRE